MTVTVYVSGASARKAKCPEPSLMTLAVCEGLATVTEAPAIGWCDEASVTVPLSVPVVPASAALPKQHNAWTTAKMATLRNGAKN
jgi:hypothetical protein